MLLVIVVSGLSLRLAYAARMPVVFDEGAYLYDGLLITQGHVPYRDFLTKAPLLLYVLALFTKLFGASLFVGRVVPILASLGTAILLFFIGRRLHSGVLGLMAAGIYSLSSVPSQLSINIQSQPLQSLLVTGSLYLLLVAPGKPLAFYTVPGLLLAAAFFVRQTTLAAGVTAALVVVVTAATGRDQPARLGWMGLGFASAVALVAGVSLFVIGGAKTADLLGYEMVHQATAQKVEAVQEGDASFLGRLVGDVRGEAGFMAEDGLPLMILFGIFLLLGTASFVSKRSGRTARWLLVGGLGALVAVLAWRAIGAGVLRGPLGAPWLFGVALLVAAALLGIIAAQGLRSLDFGALAMPTLLLAFPLLWLVPLVLLYSGWIKFRTPYAIEFLPALSLGAAVSVLWLSRIIRNSRLPSAAWACIIASGAALLVFGHAIALQRPVTGTVTLRQVEEVTAFLDSHAGPADEVLTQYAIFPFLSGNPLVYNITHPSWYASPLISEEQLALYFPPYAELIAYVELEKVPFMITDRSNSNALFQRRELATYASENYAMALDVDGIVVLERKERFLQRQEGALRAIWDHRADVRALYGTAWSGRQYTPEEAVADWLRATDDTAVASVRRDAMRYAEGQDWVEVRR